MQELLYHRLCRAAVPAQTEGWHDAAFFNIAKVLEITLNNGKVGDKQLGPQTGDMTSFTSIEDIFAAYKKQMDISYIIWQKPTTVLTSHMQRERRFHSCQHW